MNRGRINVGAEFPDSGASRAHATVIVIWDDGASPVDKEAAIMAAASKALRRVREVAQRSLRSAEKLGLTGSGE